MRVRKPSLEQWTRGLHPGGQRSAEDLTYELGAKAEMAKARGRKFTAGFLDCSKCYEMAGQKESAGRSHKTGCPGEVVSLNCGMYARPRVLSIHGVHTPGVQADSGILGGCGVAVHHLKATVKTTGGDEVEVRD